MENSPIYGPLVLAHWTYTRDEWKAFQKWKVSRKGLLHYAFHWLKARKPAPEIRITPERIWTNDVHEPFHDGDRRFRAIQIHDAGTLNIMEISYENGVDSNEIRIPIPKGKLREAIAVQEQLQRKE